jgi:2-polyprenyl-3-methyl-5-hydroxy-6-metoxy-1,4-benzoquinol methylase
METGSQKNPPLRLLVVIASFGEKNLELLRRIIARYRTMTFRADVVVVSNAPKDLGADVEVLVGLPTKDPWSLPFAHKAVMVRKVEEYDLFAYSEDDMVVTEENIRAFLRVTPRLAPDEIAGFLRYEVDPSGNRSLPEVHRAFRWKPESVRRRGSSLTAEFTNEHSGFYLLTRDQLRQAIACGEFVCAPYQGRYGTPETAATDIYTRCGFRKVVCVSELESFLIHHASNRYSGALGLPVKAFQEQIQALSEIGDRARPATSLCEVEPKVFRSKWSKSLYEKPDLEWLEAVPKDARIVLSIGCGWGMFEAELKARGAAVTALALDSVIGAIAERHGIHVLYGTLDEGLRRLQALQFDCVAMSHLLHLLPNPAKIMEECSRVLRPGGRLLLSGPNFNRFRVRLQRALPKGDYRKLRTFAESGIHLYEPSSIAKMLGQAGLRVAALRWINHAPLLAKGTGRPAMRLGCLTAKDWMLESVR